MKSELDKTYILILNQLKERIKQARLNASIAVNRELLSVYWEIGKTILDLQADEGWGAKIIDRLSDDLISEFPEIKGFSKRNLKYMRSFTDAYPEYPKVQGSLAQSVKALDNNHIQIVQDPLAQLTWYHHITLLDKVKKPEERLFYISKAIENGWSRDILVHQIESNLVNRQGNITSNFTATLPSPKSELVQQIFKDPYQLDFLHLGEEALERDLENAILVYLTNFLLELGDGFAFVKRQYHVEAGGQDYYIDLLFYHLKLRRYIVIELKIGEFKPEYAGKMNFYLSLVDDTLKTDQDESSIGLILCKTKNKVIAEYALRDASKPIGIAEYNIAKSLPTDIKAEMPTIAEIEQRMGEELSKPSTPFEEKLSKLKEKIQNMQQDSVKESKSKETIEKVIKRDIIPFLTSLTEELKKIGELFLESKFEYTIDSRWVSSDGVIAFLTTLDKPLTEITFEMRFSGLKSAGKHTFDVWQTIYIQFAPYWYEFQVDRTVGLIRKLYHDSLDKDDTKFLLESYTDFITKQIEGRLDSLNK